MEKGFTRILIRFVRNNASRSILRVYCVLAKEPLSLKGNKRSVDGASLILRAKQN
jgi:hypothetical protein